MMCKTQPVGPSVCLTHGTTQKDPREGSPLSVWMEGDVEKNWPKRLSHPQLQQAWRRLWQGHNSCGGGSLCPCTLVSTRVPASQAAVPTSWSTLTGAELTQAKMSAFMHPGSLGSGQLFTALWTVACQASRQEYWNLLANTGCHTLLEHCISCCPSRQLPWGPGAARAPAAQAAAPPPHLGLTGADPSPPGQPQEQTPVD